MNQRLASTAYRVLAAAAAGLFAIVVCAAERTQPPPGDCPQPRFTGRAPAEYIERVNPLTMDEDTLAEGERLYSGKSKSIACALCHGAKGDGKGVLAKQYSPPPRNFACRETINGIADGQLFWIIRYGSPDTAMPPARDLTDRQVWQLVSYLRRLAEQ